MKKTLLFTQIALVALTILALNAEARESGNLVRWSGCEDCRGLEGAERQRRAKQDESCQQYDETGLKRVHGSAPFQDCGMRPDCAMREERMGAAEHASNTVKLRG